MLRKLLLDPVGGEGGGTKPPVDTRAIKIQSPNPTIPQEVLDRTFDIEQLPILDSEFGSQQGVEDKKVGAPSDGDKSVDKGIKKEVSTTVKEEVVKEEGEKKVEEKKDDNSEFPNLPKGLRPPKGKDDKSKDKKEDEKNADGTIKAPAPKSNEQKAFDYTGYSAPEIAALRSMSKESREFTTNLIKQNKELAKESKNQYYQHPQGYILSPEFRDLQNSQYTVNFETKHWETQLKLLKEGKPIKDLKGFDNRGQPVYGEELKPTDALEENVRHALQTSYNLKANLSAKINEFPKLYDNYIKVNDSAVKDEFKKRFTWEADPKQLDCVVNVAGFGDKSIRQIRDDLKSILPVHYRTGLMTDLACNFLAGMAIAKAENIELQEQLNVEKLKSDEVRRAEPSSGGKPPKPKETVHGVGEFTYDPNL